MLRTSARIEWDEPVKGTLAPFSGDFPAETHESTVIEGKVWSKKDEATGRPGGEPLYTFRIRSTPDGWYMRAEDWALPWGNRKSEQGPFKSKAKAKAAARKWLKGRPKKKKKPKEQKAAAMRYALTIEWDAEPMEEDIGVGTGEDYEEYYRATLFGETEEEDMDKLPLFQFLVVFGDGQYHLSAHSGRSGDDHDLGAYDSWKAAQDAAQLWLDEAPMPAIVDAAALQRKQALHRRNAMPLRKEQRLEQQIAEHLVNTSPEIDQKTWEEFEYVDLDRSLRQKATSVVKKELGRLKGIDANELNRMAENVVDAMIKALQNVLPRIEEPPYGVVNKMVQLAAEKMLLDDYETALWNAAGVGVGGTGFGDPVWDVLRDHYDTYYWIELADQHRLDLNDERDQELAGEIHDRIDATVVSAGEIAAEEFYPRLEELATMVMDELSWEVSMLVEDAKDALPELLIKADEEAQLYGYYEGE